MNYMGEPMLDNDYFSTPCFCNINIWGADSLCVNESLSSSSTEEASTAFSEAIHALLLGQKRAEDSFCIWVILKCLQVKIIFRPKWHIWGWHILVSASGNKSHTKKRKFNNLF